MLPTVFHIITFRPVLCQSFSHKKQTPIRKTQQNITPFNPKNQFFLQKIDSILQFLQPYNIINIPDKTISNSSTLSTTPYRCLRQGYIEFVYTFRIVDIVDYVDYIEKPTLPPIKVLKSVVIKSIVRNSMQTIKGLSLDISYYHLNKIVNRKVGVVKIFFHANSNLICCQLSVTNKFRTRYCFLYVI